MPSKSKIDRIVKFDQKWYYGAISGSNTLQHGVKKTVKLFKIKGT